MKLQSSISRLAGARNNVQNAISFLEVQDGLLDTVGNILSRMSELKGLGSQDPMKSDQDIASYNNEFKESTAAALQHLSAKVQWSQFVCKPHLKNKP